LFKLMTVASLAADSQCLAQPVNGFLQLGQAVGGGEAHVALRVGRAKVAARCGGQVGTFHQFKGKVPAAVCGVARVNSPGLAGCVQSAQA
jgi:hypothetical protein